MLKDIVRSRSETLLSRDVFWDSGRKLIVYPSSPSQSTIR
jgi:hypothetical protein